MGRAAPSTDQEYWRPPNPTVITLDPRVAAVCPRCGTDFSTGALFCYVCGTARQTRAAASEQEPESLTSYLDVGALRLRFGLSIPSLIFFLIGIACMLAAVLVGFLYRAETLVEWQAIQLWRIEWLQGATAALLAGILLKKTKHHP